MTTPVETPAHKPGLFAGRKLIYIAGGLLSLCVVCVACVVIGSVLNSTPSGKATSTARAVAALTEAATKLTPAPTNTPKPSETAGPTNTIEPTAEVAASATPNAVDATEPAALPPYVEVGAQGREHFVVIDKEFSANRDALHALGKSICAESSVCVVLFWDTKSEAGTSLPLTDAQVNAEVATYHRNENTSLDEMLLCDDGSCN